MDGMTESQESNFDITTLTLIRINEICKKLDILAVANITKHPEYIKGYYGFLKAFYNNLQIMLSDKEKEKWDKTFKELERRVFVSPDKIDIKTFEYLDNTEMELRRLQKKVGFSVMVKFKMDLKQKLHEKLVGGNYGPDDDE